MLSRSGSFLLEDMVAEGSEELGGERFREDIGDHSGCHDVVEHDVVGVNAFAEEGNTRSYVLHATGGRIVVGEKDGGHVVAEDDRRPLSIRAGKLSEGPNADSSDDSADSGDVLSFSR